MAVKAQAFKKKNRLRALLSVCLVAAGIGLIGFALAKLDMLPFGKAAAEEDVSVTQDLFIQDRVPYLARFSER
ncbi:hypothetical protein [Acidaminobacter sp.]|uniref:hypothetical protein n=1 Tax=Acidaminobacter sp. TaxID=1872102 RepID=UPI0013855011|nr:hypothetical protein [Acidaminobacter sp.]MDK9711358.1 hypothetical protein [Acidaminobacter sp.]MZQ96589.1 hypothetical protein [Acidaminobacter sp.]